MGIKELFTMDACLKLLRSMEGPRRGSTLMGNVCKTRLAPVLQNTCKKYLDRYLSTCLGINVDGNLVPTGVGSPGSSPGKLGPAAPTEPRPHRRRTGSILRRICGPAPVVPLSEQVGVAFLTPLLFLEISIPIYGVCTTMASIRAAGAFPSSLMFPSGFCLPGLRFIVTNHEMCQPCKSLWIPCMCRY